MRFAFADPPYLGRAEYYRAHHPEAMIWDDPESHRDLISRLQAEYREGWVLALSERSLRTILPMCPAEARTAAWISERARFAGKAVAVRKHFEPVIFCGGREGPNRTADFVVTRQEPMPPCADRYAMDKGAIRAGDVFLGRKPAAYCRWVLDLLGFEPETDTIDDLFPGSGAMGNVVAAMHSSGHETLPIFRAMLSASKPDEGKS
jgi:hypothetical protein